MEQLFGAVLGVGSIAVGYLLSKLAKWSDEEASDLKSVRRYYNLSDLQRDLSRQKGGVMSRVFVEGVVRKDRNSVSLESEETGVSGAVKTVLTTSYTKVQNDATGKWEERSETLTNQNLSVPFRLEDSHGNGVTVEQFHQCTGYRSVLKLVHQRKTGSEGRTLGDYASNVTVNQIPTGTLTREYMLLYGTTIAMLGEAVNTGSAFSKVVSFHPEKVGSSINSLILHHETMAHIQQVVSTVLIIGGACIVVLTVLPLLRRHFNRERD